MSTEQSNKTAGYPFKVTHIGVITEDINRTIARYEAMGVGPFVRFRLPDDNFKFKRKWHYDIDTTNHVYEAAYGKMSNGMGVEIFQIVSLEFPEKDIMKHYLDTKGECIWHLGHDVESMDEAIQWMKKAGYEVIGGAEYEDGTMMCYFGTHDLGYVIQLHEVVKGSVADQLTNDAQGNLKSK